MLYTIMTLYSHHTSLVFESLVQSGFLMPQDFNCNCLCPRSQLDHKKTTDHSFNQSLDQFVSAPVLTSVRLVFWPIFYNYESVNLLTFPLALK